jgi:hypothetical protein
MNITSKSKDRFTGPVPQAADVIKKSKADKSRLIAWMETMEQIEAQMAEAERLSETLPADIDKLLKSGRMDEKTVEQLAHKRAHLDLLPSRIDLLDDKQRELVSSFEEIGGPLCDAVTKAVAVYCQVQIDAASAELENLGVDPDTAKRQALLREDIQKINSYAIINVCGGGASASRARNILWCFESYEQGLYPHSKAAEKIKKQWIKE